MGLAETARLAVRVDLEGNAQAGIQKLTGQVGKLNSGMGRVGKGVGQVGAGLARAGLFVGGAAVTGIAAAAKATVDWQDAFAGVVKTVDEADLASAGMTFRDLELSLRAMATEMPLAANELAGIAEAAGALGIAGKDIEEFTRVAALIGTTTDVSAGDAATALGQLTNVLGLTSTEYDNFAATLVDLGNKGASTESQILGMATRAGAGAKLIGIAADETLGWSAAVANLGIEVEAGGSALQKFFLGSLENVAAGGKELKIMAKVAGQTGKQFKKSFEKDASGALATFLAGLGELNESEQIATLKGLGFNDIRITRLLLGLANNTDNLTDALNTSNTAWEENTALTIEAEKRFATVKSSFQILKNNALEAAITLGEGLAPALGRAAKRLTEFLKLDSTKSGLAKIGKEIGEAIDGIDWKAVLTGAQQFVGILKGALTVAKAMYDMFSMLPTEIKAATVGFLALNKLSGGLIATGAGNIVGGLGETVARKGGSMLPGVGKLFAQPVFVTNWPPGAMVPGGKGGVAPVGGGAGKIATGLSVAAAAVSILGVIEAHGATNKQSTDHAAEIKAGLDASIAGKTLPELRTALGGVKQGITDIRSNPLLTLVQGEALTTLQAMEADLSAQIIKLESVKTSTTRLKDDTVGKLGQVITAANRTKDDTVSAIKISAFDQKMIQAAQTREIGVAKQAQVAAVRGGADRTVAAVRASRPIITTNVSVHVTPAAVTKSTTIQARYGPASGSSGSAIPGKGR